MFLYKRSKRLEIRVLEFEISTNVFRNIIIKQNGQDIREIF